MEPSVKSPLNTIFTKITTNFTPPMLPKSQFPEKVNIHDLLDECNIDYRTSGKNIGSDWTGVECPECGDNRNHCGISPSGTYYSCFVCGRTGGIYKFIKKTTNLSSKKIYDLIKEFSDNYYISGASGKSLKGTRKVTLPGTDIMPRPHVEYLLKRGFPSDDIEKIKSKYKVQAEHQTGDYKYRLIIPIFDPLTSSVPVNFAGRDISDKQSLRYKYPPNNETVTPIGSLLYHFIPKNNNMKNIVLVEGIFDHWKLDLSNKDYLSTGIISVLGTVVTDAQILLLKKLCNKKQVYILFDNSVSANKKAQDLLLNLSFCGISVKNITPLISRVFKKVFHKPYDDPGNFLKKESMAVLSIIKNLDP